MDSVHPPIKYSHLRAETQHVFAVPCPDTATAAEPI